MNSFNSWRTMLAIPSSPTRRCTRSSGFSAGLRAHPFLGTRLALKGGTVLTLFILELPRLSVDIVLNDVGAIDRPMMLAERPRVEQALERVFGRAGLTVKKTPTEHAVGKWRLSYTTALGRPGSIEVDINFMLRTPLWATARRNSHPIGGQMPSWRAAPAETCSTLANCFGTAHWTSSD